MAGSMGVALALCLVVEAVVGIDFVWRSQRGSIGRVGEAWLLVRPQTTILACVSRRMLLKSRAVLRSPNESLQRTGVATTSVIVEESWLANALAPAAELQR